jgi:hypothetical protein
MATTPPNDPIDEFINLPKDQQLSTLQSLAPEKQDALLAKVKERNTAAAGPPPEQPGLFERFRQGVGLPSLDDIKNAPYATAQFSHGAIPESPLIAAGKSIFKAGKEAVANPSEENTGKLVTKVAAPVMGSGVENLPGDIKSGNVMGSTGDFLGVLANLALMRGAKRPSAAEATNKLSFATGGGTDAIMNSLNDLRKAAGDKPVHTVNDFLSTVQKAKTDLRTESGNALAPIANKPTVPLGVAQKIRDLVTPNMDLTAEGRQAKQAIENAAIEFEQPGWTYGKLDLERLKRNADLASHEKKSPIGRYTSEKGNINVAIDKAVADGIREKIYPEMDKVAGQQPGYFRDLKDRHGSLIELESTLGQRVKDLREKQSLIQGAPSKLKATKIAKGATGKLGLGDLLSTVASPRENPLGEANAAAKAGFGGGALRTGARVAVETLPARYLLTMPDADQGTPMELPLNHPLAATQPR